MVVSSESHTSLVIGVPPYIVANAFKDVTCIKEFSKNNLVSCCLIETGTCPSTIGTIRRVTIDLPMFRDTILREKLALVEEDPYRTRIRMDYVPCDANEAYRSPFGEEGTKMLLNASTLITVTSVSSCSNRCFLEISTTFTVDIALPPDGLQRASEDPTYRNIEQFWKTYVSGLALALEDYIFSPAFSVDGRGVGSEFEGEYLDVENTFCRWAAQSSDDISRLEAMEVLEKALNAWIRVQRELKHQQMINLRLAADAKGLAAVTAEHFRFLEAENSVSAKKTLPEPLNSTAPAAAGCHEALKMDFVEANTERQKRRAEKSIEQGLKKLEHVPFFSSGGGRCLSASELEGGEQAKSPLEQQIVASPQRNTPRQISSALLRTFLTEIGTINERVAHELFNSLDTNQTGFVTEDEVGVVLSNIDTLGLYEDKDGTIRQLDERRQVVGPGVFKTTAAECYSFNAPSNAAATVPFSFSSSLQKTGLSSRLSEDARLRGQVMAGDQKHILRDLLCRHNAEKKAMREELLKRRAAQMVSNFAYRSSGKLHYDEFCLMMLNLLKEH